MLIEKQNMPMVAMEFMNDVHGEDIDIINELFGLVLDYEQNPTSERKEVLTSTYQKWYDHTVEHFAREEVMMEERKFPPYQVHKGEHDRALTLMKDTFDRWEQSNDIRVLKEYLIEHLPIWLENHIKTMDTVTAMFFKTGLSPCSRS